MQIMPKTAQYTANKHKIGTRVAMIFT
ncbi:hypothetical protein OK016_12430 [Vibrio chagasii]|nr:hypothetical protein [Vibrio chagasii]